MPVDTAAMTDFLAALGADQEPLAVYYADQPPAEGVTPAKPFTLPTLEDEAAGQVDWPTIFGSFSCVLGNIWRARKKGIAAYFDREHTGCLGGAFYLGFNKPQVEAIVHYVSTGVPGMMEGELYVDSPEACRRYFAELDPEPALGRYCIFQPLSQVPAEVEPLLVVFFGRPELIAGLHQLAFFVTNDAEAVMSPFGAGCADLVTWPRYYLARGRQKAVVGGWDPSCRKYLATDELSFATPYAMYQAMAARWRESFLTRPVWDLMQKKIARSKRAWGED